MVDPVTNEPRDYTLELFDFLNTYYRENPDKTGLRFQHLIMHYLKKQKDLLTAPRQFDFRHMFQDGEKFKFEKELMRLVLQRQEEFPDSFVPLQAARLVRSIELMPRDRLYPIMVNNLDRLQKQWEDKL